VCGYNTTTIIQTLHIYNITTNSWSTGTNIPIVIYVPTATLYQDKIYVIGGTTGTVASNNVYVYNITTNTWSTGTTIPITTYGHTAFLYDDKIYIIGGHIGVVSNTIYTYSLIPSSDIIDIVKGYLSTTKVIDIKDTHDISSITSDLVYFAFKFGNDFKVFKNSAWSSIARLNDTTYEYYNGTDWVAAPQNNIISAISSASQYVVNQMTASEIDALNYADFNGLTTTEVSITLNATGYNYPSFESLSIVGNKAITAPVGKDIKWRLTSEASDDVDLYGVRLRW
jgi:hypothetical protein